MATFLAVQASYILQPAGVFCLSQRLCDNCPVYGLCNEVAHWYAKLEVLMCILLHPNDEVHGP